MKSLIILLIGINIFSYNIYGQSSTNNTTTKEFDPNLAQKLGADDYGMKSYVFAMLKTGKAKVDTEKRKNLIDGHLKNIGKLAEEGKLVLAGPFMDDQDWRGIFIFNVQTVEEAKSLIKTDPAIQAGVFEVELHPWYGSATLIEVMKLHKKIQKKEF